MYMSTASTRRKLVRTVCRYRTIEIQAGAHPITVVGPMPADLRTPSTTSRLFGSHPGFQVRTNV